MLADDVKELENEYSRLLKTSQELSERIIKLKKQVESYKKCCEMVLPVKVHTHKARRNTTVVFRDGSSMTVKRKAGEKDCIETAIAYCIMKQLITNDYLKKLIKNKEEH